MAVKCELVGVLKQKRYNGTILHGEVNDMKVLVSGFEPFGGLTTNPTEQLVQEAKKFSIDGVTIETVLLPVVYHRCTEQLIEVIEREKPAVVLSLGLAYGRSEITPERIGINIQDTFGEGTKGDNEGRKPVDVPIDPNGPDGLFSTLPNRLIVEALKQHQLPAVISNTAGTYICNNTLYGVLHYIQQHQLPIKAGFVHIPATPEMVIDKPDIPSLPFEQLKKALHIIIETIKDNG